VSASAAAALQPGNGLTRSSLLKAGGLALFAAALPGGRKALSLLSVSRTPAHLKLDTYRPHVGTTFRVRQNGARPLDLRLVRITELGPGRFGLLFKGPRRRDFEQDARLTVTHPVVGRFPLSIGAVGASKRGQHYEAIVNRPGA